MNVELSKKVVNILIKVIIDLKQITFVENCFFKLDLKEVKDLKIKRGFIP